MFKKVFCKTFSSLLALLVLMSTFSFTLEKHFCGDTLIDVAVFSELSNCGMDMKTIHTNDISEKSCCKEIVEIIKGQDQLKKVSLEDVHFDQLIFANQIYPTYLNLFDGLPEYVVPHQYYSPPNLVPDILVLEQVFII